MEKNVVKATGRLAAWILDAQRRLDPASLQRDISWLQAPVDRLHLFDPVDVDGRDPFLQRPEFWHVCSATTHAEQRENPAWLDADNAVLIACSAEDGADLWVALDLRRSADDPRVLASYWGAGAREHAWREAAPSFSELVRRAGLQPKPIPRSEEDFESLFREFVPRYLGRAWRSDDGVEKMTIDAAEQQLQCAIPTALRAFYLNVGSVYALCKQHINVRSPEALVFEDDYLVFMDENPGGLSWGIFLAHLLEPDPPAWCRNNTAPAEWHPDGRLLATFLRSKLDAVFLDIKS